MGSGVRLQTLTSRPLMILATLSIDNDKTIGLMMPPDGMCTWLRVAFIPFLVAGDPDLETTEEALKRLDAAGADVIELGVPYSVSLSSCPLMRISRESLAKPFSSGRPLSWRPRKSRHEIQVSS